MNRLTSLLDSPTLWPTVMNILPWLFILFSAALVARIIWNDYETKLKARRIAVMSYRERQRFLEKLLSDIITKGISDAEYEGAITFKEQEGIFNKCARGLNLPDLYHPHVCKHRDLNELKEELKEKHKERKEVQKEVEKGEVKSSILSRLKFMQQEETPTTASVLDRVFKRS